jgi:hypothetical protein
MVQYPVSQKAMALKESHKDIIMLIRRWSIEKINFGLRASSTARMFYLSVEDDLVNDGGIMDLWVREARIFKYGSGVGTNFSISGAKERSSAAEVLHRPDELSENWRSRAGAIKSADYSSCSKDGLS